MRIRTVVGAGRGVDAQPSCVVAGGEQDLVGHFCVEGVHVVERRSLVWPAVDARNVAVVRRRERVVLVIEEVDQAKADVVLFGWNDIEVAAVDLLLLRVGAGCKQVCAAEGKVWRWIREGSEEADTVLAQLGLRDDVAGKTAGAAGGS